MLFAVREDFIETNKGDLQAILDVINNTTSEFKNIPSIDKIIANRYQQKLEDVQEWLSLTEWSQVLIDEETVMKVQKQLNALDIIPKIVDYKELIYRL